MEFAITVTIVLFAGTFIVRRWFRSANRALKPTAPGTCGGGCEGCAIGSNGPVGCNDSRQSDTTSMDER